MIAKENEKLQHQIESTKVAVEHERQLYNQGALTLLIRLH
jgi:hypothetical protein